MNLRSIDLNLLVVFDAVFTDGNLTRAADRIGMSQPAVSNALARLREALGDPLFERRGRGMEPTARARELAKPVRQALDLLQAGLSGDGRFDFRTARVSFTVATEDVGEIVILPRLMNWLSQSAPGVRVRIATERARAAIEQVRRGQVDLAFDYIPLEGDDLEVQHLLSEPRVVMSRRGHPRVADGLSLEGYLSLQHVAFNRSAPGAAIVAQALKRLGHERDIAMEVPHYLSIPAVLLQTDYVATVPRRVAAALAEHYDLRMVKLPFEVADLPIYMSWNKANSAVPAHRWFRERITALCARL